MLKINEQILDFDLPGFYDGGVKKFNSLDYRGKWLVIFTYPADFTFVCPTEIEGFEKHYQDFKKVDAEVLGISIDSPWSHKAWVEQKWKELSYPLLSDTERDFIYKYGVDTKNEHGATEALRATFIVDPDGKLRYLVVSDNNVGRSVDETLRVLQALQTGKLCPVEWHPGEGTLN